MNLVYNLKSFGFLQNIVDSLEINLLCVRPSGIRWTRIYNMDELAEFKAKRLKMYEKFEV